MIIEGRYPPPGGVDAWYPRISTYRPTPEHWGAEGDGVRDDSAAIRAWLVYCAASGISGYLPNATYLLKTPIDLSVTGNIRIEAAPYARIKGSPELGSNPLLKIYAANREQYEFKWTGGIFDNSEVPFVLAGQSGTCLALTRLYRIVIEKVDFMALADYEVSQAMAVSDSGITAVDCRYVTIANCYFRGQSDAGVYISGNNADSDTTDDGGQYSFYGNHFDRCSVGLTSKREVRNISAVANTFHLCNYGLTFFYASATVPPGHAASVTANTFHKCQTAIDCRGGYGYVLCGNTIEDWGFELDGVTETRPLAIRLLNTRDSVVANNQMHMVDWAPAAAIGVQIDYTNSTSIDQTSINNSITGNVISGSFYGIRETIDAVASGEGNHIWNNFCIGMGGGRQVQIDNSASKTNVLYAEPDIRRLRMFTGQDEILRIQDGVLDTFKLDVKQIVYPSNTVLTIASGEITVDGYDCRLDTEGLAASDDLDTINGGIAGMQVRIRPNSGARTVVVKNGTGNITLAADVTLDEAWKSITLQYDTAISAWVEVCRGGI